MKTFNDLTDAQKKKFSDFCSKLLKRETEAPDTYIKDLLTRYETEKANLQIASANLGEWQKAQAEAQAKSQAHAESIDAWIMWHLFEGGARKKTKKHNNKGVESIPAEAEVH